MRKDDTPTCHRASCEVVGCEQRSGVLRVCERKVEEYALHDEVCSGHVEEYSDNADNPVYR